MTNLGFGLFLFAFVCLISSVPAQGDTPPSPPKPITFSIDDWKITLSGFLESDFISDSTRGLTEFTGNAPISRPGTLDGSNGRTQMSIRNSRFGINLSAPKYYDWNTRVYFEWDFLGFDPTPGTGTTESAFFSNPTVRVRHGYFEAQNDDFSLLVGQTWSLFGWQPYYFLATAQVQPVPAMLYTRNPQIRAAETVHLNPSFTLQTVLDLQRPPQRDSEIPDFQGGIRIAFDERKAGFTGASAGPLKAQPMSLGLSGILRDFEIPNPAGSISDQLNFLGYAYAVDIMLPLIASPDGKEIANTLCFLGEYTSGSGYGDQLINWTGNQPQPLNSAQGGTMRNLNLDAGIGGYNANGNFSLIHLTTLNFQLQYHLPGNLRTWMTTGAGQLYSDNMANLLTASGRVGYNREQVYFGNVFHSFTDHIRTGVEYAFQRTTYVDGVVASNNRYQLTAQFIF